MSWRYTFCAECFDTVSLSEHLLLFIVFLWRSIIILHLKIILYIFCLYLLLKNVDNLFIPWFVYVFSTYIPLWYRRSLTSVLKAPHTEGAGISKFELYIFLKIFFALLQQLIAELTEDISSGQHIVSIKKYRGPFHPFYHSLL